MSSRRVPIALGSGGTRTEESRAFFQSRLTLFGGRIRLRTSIIEICSHHLHTSPEPPSSRRTQPIPPLLEDVILQCLAKPPEGRRRDAKTLQKVLQACAPLAPWSEDEAAGWWAAFRRTQGRQPKPAATEREDLTAVIDLAHRVNPWRVNDAKHPVMARAR